MESAAVAVDVEPVPIVRDTHDSGGHLQQAFDACADGLYRYVLIRVGGDRHAADDLLQQACCVAARHWRQPANAHECEAWLRGIARNLIRQHWRCLRKERRRVPLENAEVARQLVERMESGPAAVDALARDESVTQLLLAVTSLPADEQRLVFGFYFDGRSQVEIAEDLGVTMKSVESRLYRIRSRLRAILKGNKDGVES